MNIHLLPDFQQPMEPILYPRAFDSDEFLYEVKWDGVRILAVLDRGQVYLVNRHLREKTAQYLELQDLADWAEADSLVLDGEMVVLQEGRPSFASVMQRDQTRSRENSRWLQRRLPANYLVFDLLYLNGECLLQRPYEKRKEILSRVLAPGPVVQLVENFSGGVSLFQTVESMGLEGMVAKKRRSSYQQGKKHSSWFKIKCRRQQCCLVGGYSRRGNRVNSLLLGVLAPHGLIYVGKAGSGLSGEDIEFLTRELGDLTVGQSPFVNLTVAPPGAFFLEPVLAVVVEFSEWTADLKMRHPVIKGFTAADTAQCRV